MSHDPTASDRPWPTLQRADAERVLRRAIEIESKGGEWLDGDELRRVADAVDLDPRSVERALAEMSPPVPAPRHSPAHPAEPWFVNLARKVFAVGVTVGLSSALLGLCLMVIGVPEPSLHWLMRPSLFLILAAPLAATSLAAGGHFVRFVARKLRPGRHSR